LLIRAGGPMAGATCAPAPFFSLSDMACSFSSPSETGGSGSARIPDGNRRPGEILPRGAVLVDLRLERGRSSRDVTV
jgi:hypothetical protein